MREATVLRQPRKTGLGNQRGRIAALVREELSRKSLSYGATALLAVFFGIVTLPVFTSAVIPLEESAREGGWAVDLLFLAVISTLSVNVLSRSYFFIHHDPFYGWLAFLRALPVSPGEVVLARSLIMLPATAGMTAVFFVPIISAARFLMADFKATQFLWFVLIWLGYALAAGGLNLYLELGVRGGAAMASQFAWLVVLVAAVWLANGGLVVTAFELAGAYGPLPAGISLSIGGSLFALLARATRRRLAGREFSR